MHELLITRLRRSLAQCKLLPRALRLVFQAGGRWTAAWAVLLVLQGLVPAATVLLTRSVVDGFIRVLREGAMGPLGYTPLLWPLAAMGLALLLGEVLRAAAGWVREIQSELVQDHVMALVHAKSVQVDLAFYDSPDFFDRLHRARAEASYRPAALMEALGSLAQNAVTLLAMLAVLLSFGLWIPLALAVGTFPAFFVVLRYAIRQHEFRLRVTADERRTWYYDWLLTSRDAASELRLFDLGARFQSAYRSRARLRGERLALARGNAAAELAAGTIALAVTGASAGWMLWRALYGLVSLGGLAMFYQAFQQGLRLMRGLLDNVGQLYYNTLFLGNLFEFLELQPTLHDPESPAAPPPILTSAIHFDHVTFRYPGSAQPVLRDFSLEIPAGRIVAFVGPNGAGKSTFIKLLCRLYDPESGRIELDGVDLRAFSLAEIRSRFTVLFQEPVRYNASVSENISLGGRNPEEVFRAAEAAGAEGIIAGLPNTYESLLGKTFLEGSELSAGQWQRLALARAFYRAAPILVLDEPTSAMDPWAENDWLERFRTLAAGRTAILITHRFTTAMRADIIYVLADGDIVESGSHRELLAAGGLYAQSWSEQTSSPVGVPL